MVQYFQPSSLPEEEETAEDATTWDESVLGGRSLNSYYTKSAESEVEDFIKDILLIGSGQVNHPGRRKLKDSPDVRWRLQERDGGRHQRHHQVPGVDDETLTLDTFDDTDEMVTDEEECEIESPSTAQHYLHHPNDTRHHPTDELSSLWDFLFGAPDTDSDNAKKLTTLTKQQGSDGGDGLEGLLNLAAFFGVLSTESDTDYESDTTSSSDGSIRPRRNESRSPLPPVTRPKTLLKERVSVEEELRLVALARQAARCMHRIRGHEFDDTYKINIATDILFSVVDLELPLGLIFQENEIGCWVTKVLPCGSASRNGKVQVGDQLVAIDGVSAIDLKVGQMAKLVTSRTSDIEFTFLRYIGPFRPISESVLDEGNEVPTQTQVRAKRTPPAIAAEAPTPRKKVLFGRNTSPRSVNNLSLESEKLPTKTTATENKRGRFRLFRRRKES